ncbi:hypothetical protein Tco_1089156 [Tanacetum coccineum]
METSSLNSEEMELQQMQLDERELHQKCLALFEKLKKHLGFLYRTSDFQRESCHGHNSKTCLGHDSETCLVILRTQFKKFFDSKESLITGGATIEACLVTEGATLEACLVNEGIPVNDNTSVTKSSGTESEKSSLATPFSISEDENRCSNKDSSSSMNECSRSRNENRSSYHESTSSRIDADPGIGFSNDSDTLLGVYYDLFKNMFAHRIQSHEQPQSIFDIYEVNENNSNIISDIPNMDPNRNKEEHDVVDYEQQRAFFASLIHNLKCDIEKCNEVNREAQQANALLKNKLERYKEKEKHFAKDMTIETGYYKKIKLSNDKIS